MTSIAPTAPFVVAGGLYFLSRVTARGNFLDDIAPVLVLFAAGIGLYVTPITTAALMFVARIVGLFGLRKVSAMPQD